MSERPFSDVETAMDNRTIRIHFVAALFLCCCITKATAQATQSMSVQGATAGQDATHIVFEYGLNAIRGTVHDPQGRPLKDVEVRSQDMEARNAPSLHTLALTDQSGEFTTKGARILFLEKKGYTPSAIKLEGRDERLSLVLVPESKKQLPKCANRTDLPSISLNSLRYSLPAGIRWEELKGDKPDFMICTVWEQECLFIYAAQEYESSREPDLPSADSQRKYRVTQEFEFHPELAELGFLEGSSTFGSASGRDWINWTGTMAGKPWRWFNEPNQIAQYYDASSQSAKVFDAIINSACRERDFRSTAKKAAK